MRALRTALVAVVALLPFAPSPAGAAEPAGVECEYSGVSEPQASQRGTAEIDAGPIVLDSDPAGQPVWGSVTCTLLVNGSRHSDTAAAVATVTSDVTPGVAHLAPTLVWYGVDPDDVVVLCTRVDVVGGPTYYWTPPQTSDGAGSWSTDPDAPCDGWHAGSELLATLLDQAEAALDTVVCLPLAVLFPPEGDVDGIWDCPPYGS